MARRLWRGLRGVDVYVCVSEIERISSFESLRVRGG